MSKQIENSVIAAISRQKRLDPAVVRPDSSLADLGISSLDAITIVYEIEEEFDVEVANKDLETLRTVGDIIDGIHQLLRAKS
jgi:acyl carrier protein